ncbi:MAG: DUF3368 domain-containing protein [Undibacterium sp.]|nr:DUF3368 domain-containing protein [Opitutaceae bacterium]
MVVVGDSSVLIALKRIGHQPLLHTLYGQVHVPDAVWREVFASATPAHSVPTVPPWIVRHQVRDPSVGESLRDQLDRGEIEAILLARELAADLLLIDERLGRQAARRFGVPVRGLLGVLADARRRGHVPALAPLLRRLRENGFWIADDLIEETLRAVGEASPSP